MSIGFLLSLASRRSGEPFLVHRASVPGSLLALIVIDQNHVLDCVLELAGGLVEQA